MTVASVFIFGAGYSGKAFAHADASGAKIVGTTRSAQKFDALRRSGIEPLAFDGSMTAEIAAALEGSTHLIVSIAPDESGDPVLGCARGAILAMPKLEWIGYLSTVGVYGDHQGGRVDETSACRPVSARSVERLAAEQAWQALAAEAGRPLAVLRLSGIYGPGRNAFANLAGGTARRIVKPGQVFNRIHVEDIGRVTALAAPRKLAGTFNLADDEPAPPQDLVTYAARLMGVAPPPETPFEAAQMTEMARSFYSDNKRVSNKAIKQALGIELLYPTYREGLEAIYRQHA